MKRRFVLTFLVFIASFRFIPAMADQKEQKTVAERLEEYGAKARTRWQPFFAAKQLKYPPSRLVFVGLKEEKFLEIYVVGSDNQPHFLRQCGILAASGVAGPKLREGDRQVPEGIYPIEWLNPNSSYHLSMRIGYPNEFDREQARREGRPKLGGDIMIHGNAVSIGCLAMGDEVAEDLFVLAADTGITNITVILTPVDFRKGRSVPASAKLPPWTDELYQTIKARLKELPVDKTR